MTPIAPHITAFLRDRLPVERGVSMHTRDSYAYAFQLLFAFASARLKVAPSQLAVEHIDAPLVLAFLEHLETKRGNSALTRNVRLTAIRSFMRFMEFRLPSALDQIRRVLSIPSKKAASRTVPYLNRKEAQALLDGPDPRTRKGIRDRAMLHLAFAVGLRSSEVVGLRVEDIQFGAEPCVFVRGKGRRERYLPLWKETADAIRAWLAIRGAAPAPELFLSSRNGPMTRSCLRYAVAQYVAAARDQHPALRKKRVSPHVLRHGCAVMIHQATGDIRKVALWLGHESARTSEVYTRVEPSTVLEGIQDNLPPALRPGKFRAPDKLLTLLQESRRPGKNVP
jgi:integrase/recombinase XerD